VWKETAGGEAVSKEKKTTEEIAEVSLEIHRVVTVKVTVKLL